MGLTLSSIEVRWEMIRGTTEPIFWTMNETPGCVNKIWISLVMDAFTIGKKENDNNEL